MKNRILLTAYNRRGGISAAQGKRMAKKRRNVLRARGQYRQAVR